MSRFCGFVTFFVIISSIIEITSSASELRFVSVIFRHGDRAPLGGSQESYPTDPYFNNVFHPMGPGGLTNNGKQREFAIGEELRRRYGTFLGDIYVPRDIVARSSDFSRTKMSLSLVLAALYPPAPLQSWHPTLKWQPIPMIYQPAALDLLLIPEECPQYIEEYERVKTLPEIVRKVEVFRPLMNNLTVITGKLINDSNDMYYLYHALMGESSVDLELPKWTESLFPDGPLYKGTLVEYEVRNYNDKLKRLNGGTLLRRISEDMVAVEKNDSKVAHKLNLFSGHESNIAGLLHTLGLYKPHIPAYSSAIFIELISQEDAYYVKVLHYLGIPPIVETLTIPGCEELCPLNDFLRLLETVIPTNEELVCQKSAGQPAAINVLA